MVEYIFAGGPLDGETVEVGNGAVDNNWDFYQYIKDGLRYTYDFPPPGTYEPTSITDGVLQPNYSLYRVLTLTGSPETIPAVEDEVADPSPSYALNPISAVEPNYGTVVKWATGAPCVGSSLVADILLSSTITFQLSGAASGVSAYHFVGDKRLSTPVNCTYINIGKTYLTVTDASGIAKIYHRWRDNSYINSQWYVPTASGANSESSGWSHPVECHTSA